MRTHIDILRTTLTNIAYTQAHTHTHMRTHIDIAYTQAHTHTHTHAHAHAHSHTPYYRAGTSGRTQMASSNV